MDDTFAREALMDIFADAEQFQHLVDLVEDGSPGSAADALLMLLWRSGYKVVPFVPDAA